MQKPISERRECGRLKEIDADVMKGATKQMSEEDLLVLDMVRTGSSPTKVAAYKAGQAASPLCILCGKHNEDTDHFWYCEKLEVARKEADKAIEEANQLHLLPISVRHGIPPI